MISSNAVVSIVGVFHLTWMENTVKFGCQVTVKLKLFWYSII